VGRSQFPCALLPGQPSSSRRWHPCCRRCLLKGCERWFLPRRPQARYCGAVCQKAARRWRCWLASQRYRASARGKERRREQDRRYRVRVRQRLSPAEPVPPSRHVEPAASIIEAETHASQHSDGLLQHIEPAASIIEGETPPKIDPSPVIPAVSEGQRPGGISPKPCGLPCHRPGCYVLFLPSVASLDQKFCSASCRKALRRVRQREARLRRRRRRGAQPLRRPHRGPPGAAAFMSSHS
jgi:hypothetical protein